MVVADSDWSAQRHSSAAGAAGATLYRGKADMQLRSAAALGSASGAASRSALDGVPG